MTVVVKAKGGGQGRLFGAVTNAEIAAALEKAGVKTVSIEYLRDMAYSLTGFPKPVETTDKITCIIEYRDGTVIDVIYQRKGEV
jgi:citrate lyase subunit alpha/citrate CoA-transferase